MHVALCMMADHEALRQHALRSVQHNGNFCLFIDSYFKNGTTQTTLLKRTDLLKLLFRVQMVEGMQTMVCDSNIRNVLNFFIGYIFGTANRKTSDCKCVSIMGGGSVASLELNDDHWNRMRNFQNVDFSSNRICDGCKSNVQDTFRLQDLLFFVTDRNDLHENIPHVSVFQGAYYQLSGIVEEFRGFFIAHVLRPNKKWYCFDHTNKAIKESSFKNVINIKILCFKRLEISSYDEFTFQHVLYNSCTRTYAGKEKETRIVHACGPNSILHCLACLFIDMPALFDGIDSEEIFLTFLKAYSTRSIDLIYETRYKILEPHFKINEKSKKFEINCFTNIGGILNKMIEHIFPSVTIWCTCSATTKQHFSMLDINYSQLSVYGLNSLDNCIAYPRRICEKCQSVIDNRSLGNILFFDVQPLHLNSEEEQINVANTKVSRDQISQTIHIDETSYTLKGIIEYEDPIHYTVNCLRINNKWYKFDDIRQTITESPCMVLPHLLVYVKNVGRID